MTAPLAPEEEARLATLRALDLLDTLPEQEFDDLAEVARVLLDVPFAFVTLVDRDRQWFKAKAGFEICEVSRDVAFCAHAILSTTPLVVPDTTEDPRFFDNPLVTGEPGVRFYAGVPIVIDGHAVGTLCCIDLQPRTPESRQLDALTALARQLESLIAARRRAARFAEGERRFQAFFDHAPFAAFMKDAGGHYQFANRSFERVVGRNASAILDAVDEELFPSEAAQGFRFADAEVRRTGRAMEIEEDVPTENGPTERWRTFKFPVEIEGQVWVGGVGMDISALRAAEAKVRDQNAELVQREEALTFALLEAETSRASARVAATRFEQLFDGLPVACFTYGEGGTIHEWNAAAEALWGIRADDALLASIYDTVVGEPNRAWSEEVHRRVFAGETVPGEERLETMRDGRERWLLTSTFPLRRPSGEIVGAVSASLDVTERKRAEEEMREAKLFAESIAESATSMLYLVDFDTKTQVWSNRDMAETLGYGPDELRAPGIDLLAWILHPDDLAAMPRISEALCRAQDLTERKRMEAEIRSSEARFRTVLDSLYEGVVVQDAPGRVTMWNRSAERILGISGECLDLRSKSDPRSVAFREDGSDFPIEERPVARAIREGRPHEAVIGMSLPDGGERWHSVMAVPLLPEDGGPAEFAVASFMDITERKRMEAAQRESEARFRTVVESLHEGLTVQNVEGEILLWNPSAQRIIGRDITGTNVSDGRGTEWRILHEDGTEYDSSEVPITRALATGEPQVGAVLGVETAEGVRWLSVNASPLTYDSDGSATEAVSSFVDITERMRMELALRESETRFRTVVESLTEGLVVHDEGQRVVYWNESAERILGMTGEQLRGLSQMPKEYRIVNEDGTESLYEDRPVAHAMRTGKVQPARTLGVHRPDGEFRWISVGASPVAPDDGGRPTEAVVSILDITEQYEQDRRLRQYSAELEEANTRLQNLATTDGLTGLKNHRFFQDWLRRQMDGCVRSGIPLSIALLDVDRFKLYNDDFGHQAGDAVLRGVAGALEQTIRGGDLAARYGGEEFVLVLPGADETEAVVVAERVRQAIAEVPLPDRSVTASFGVATFDAALTDAPSMIRAADEALYRSKDGGRNRVTHCRDLSPVRSAA